MKITPSIGLRRIAALGLSVAMVGGLSLVAAAPASATPVPVYSISGTVNVDNGDGTPVPADAATVTDVNNPASSANTDADGNFTLSGLIDGHYTLEVSQDGYATVTTDTSVAGDDTTLPETVILMADAPVEEEPATYSISGVVTASDSNPAFAPNVLLTGIDGESDNIGAIDENGNFEFPRRQPGADLQLVFSADGYGTQVVAVPITDHDVTVSIELLPNLPVGTVTISGTPIVGKVLTAETANWPAGTTFTFEWFWNGGEMGGGIDGATGSSYTVTDAVDTRKIGVNVIGSNAGFAPTTVQSELTSEVSAPKMDAAAAPVANSTDLAAYLTANDSTPQAQTSTGLPAGELNPGKSYTANVTWSAPDSFVDVYLYSTPILVGSFPVVGGVAQIALSADVLSKLAAGSHTLVVVGQSSGAVSSVAISVSAVLAATGFDAGAPLGAAALLLLLGGALVLVRRRRHVQTA